MPIASMQLPGTGAAAGSVAADRAKGFLARAVAHHRKVTGRR
jgi:hypothetical protein